MASSIVVLDYGSGNLRSAERALARAGATVRVTADPDAALDCDGLVVPGVGAFAACMAGIRSVGGEKVIARRIELGRPVLGICVGMQVLFSAGVEHGVSAAGCAVWPGTVERLDAPVLPHMGWNTVTAAAGSALFAGIGAGTRFYFVHSYALRMRDAGPLLADGARITVTEHGEPFAAAVEHGVAAAGCAVWPGPVERLDAPVLPHMGWNTVTAAPGSKLFDGIGAGTRFYFVHSYALRMRDAGPLLADGARITVTEHGEPFAAAVEQGVVAATQFHPEKSGDAGAAVLRNWLETL